MCNLRVPTFAFFNSRSLTNGTGGEYHRLDLTGFNFLHEKYGLSMPADVAAGVVSREVDSGEKHCA
jgi:hypothetical protein